MNPMRIFFAVIALWLGSEIVLIIFKRSRSGSTRLDRGSLGIVWIVIAASTVLASLSSGFRATRMGPEIRPYAFWAGIALIFLGAIVRFSAVLTLRRYFTVDVAIANDHKLVDTGLYAIIRHPAYFGSFIQFLGLGLSFRNWLSVIVMVAGAVLAFARRVHVEERALLDALGEDYRAYAARTKRFIPGVY